MARGDHGNARIAAHSLRSMAATVGAVQVSQAAAEVEAMLAASQAEQSAETLHLAERDAAFSSLAGRIRQILVAEAAQQAVTSAPVGESPSVDWASLLEMLDAGDVRAKSVLNQSRSALQSSWGRAGQDLLKAVDQYEFKEAATHLRELLGQQLDPMPTPPSGAPRQSSGSRSSAGSHGHRGTTPAG